MLAGLLAGDESMFVRVLDAWSDGMLRLARAHVSTDASAEDVVQDTWLAVIKGLDRFEGRSSLKTWVYRILVNTAKNRGLRESRTVPWTSVAGVPDDVGPEGGVLNALPFLWRRSATLLPRNADLKWASARRLSRLEHGAGGRVYQ